MLKYGSPVFWAVLSPAVRFVTATDAGYLSLWRDEPQRFRAGWSSAKGALSYRPYLNIDPASIPYWKDSLRERPHDWQVPNESTPEDMPSWARDEHCGWHRRYWAGFDDGDPCCWNDGKTAWSSGRQRTPWPYVVLADPSDPDREPPAGLVPEVRDGH